MLERDLTGCPVVRALHFTAKGLDLIPDRRAGTPLPHSTAKKRRGGETKTSIDKENEKNLSLENYPDRITKGSSSNRNDNTRRLKPSER